MADTIIVDPPQLRAVASSIGQSGSEVAALLGRLGGIGSVNQFQLGRSLEDFRTTWLTALRMLAEDVDACRTELGIAATQWEQQDAALLVGGPVTPHAAVG